MIDMSTDRLMVGWQKCTLGLKVFYVLLHYCCRHVKGVVEISPSAVAPVCQVEDQLELNCTSSGTVHRWEFTVFPENMTYPSSPFTSADTSVIFPPLTISTSMITLSRISDQHSLPLTSRAVVKSVSSGLNGTVVNCFEGSFRTDSVATTTILIIDPGQFELSIRSDAEQFSSDRVTVNLEWTLLNSQIYYQQFLHNVSVNAVPQLRNVMFTGNMRAQLVLSYNTLYNVNVTQNSACQQLIRTTFLELNYIKCTNPMELTNARAVGYEDPALEGQSITFTCAPGQVFNGSNQSTCTWNGKWEPDPGEVDCIGPGATATTVGQSVTTGTTILGTSNLDNASLRAALISVSCLLVVVSVLTFIIGLICGCCLSQRWRKLTKHKQSTSTSHTTEHVQVEDPELKENVAYITVHPR